MSVKDNVETRTITNIIESPDLFARYAYNRNAADRFRELERKPGEVDSFQITIQLPDFANFVGGVVVSPRSGRRRLHWYDPKTQQSLNMNYAKYLYQLYLRDVYGVLVPEGFEVDHKNNNKLDDRIENYQLLTKSQNSKKQGATLSTHIAIMVCPVCGDVFSRSIRTTHLSRSCMEAASTCGLSCRKLFYTAEVADEDIIWIRHHQVLHIVNSFDFQYEEYFGVMYPRTEIIRSVSRELYENTPTAIQAIKKLAAKVRLISDIVRLTKENRETRQQIADRLGVRRLYVDYIIRNQCPELTRKQIRDSRIEEIRKLYLQGGRIVDIANTMNLTYKAVSKLFHRYIRNTLPAESE